jgi:diguanylate cyclase (GGDEF)-like protein/PAS domain S-box-containing protein
MQLEYELLINEGNSDERADRLRTLLDIIQVGIVIIDQNHRVVENNRYFAEMLGYSDEEMLNLYIWDWEADMSEQEIRKTFVDLTNVQTKFTTRHRRKNGSIYDAEVTVAGTRVNGENMSLCICTDISERLAVEKQLQFLSLHDQLTGLPNRTKFERSLIEFIENPIYPVSIISCDMDYLKLINDSHGHLAGDMQLVQSARILRKAAGEHGFVARLGGDEFVIWLPGSGISEARTVIRKIMRGIREFNHNQNASSRIPLLISVGCASSDGNPELTLKGIRDMYSRADLNMLRFKRLAKRLIEKNTDLKPH